MELAPGAPDTGTDAPVVPTVLPGLTWWSPHLTRGSSSLGPRGPGYCHPAENQGSYSKPSAPEALQVLPISAGTPSNLNPRDIFLRPGKIATITLPLDQRWARFPEYNLSSRKAVFRHFPYEASKIHTAPPSMGLGYFHSIASPPPVGITNMFTSHFPGLKLRSPSSPLHRLPESHSLPYEK